MVADCSDGETRLASFNLELSEAEADALRIASDLGPFRRST